MRTAWLVTILRLALVLAVAASTALVFEYMNAGDPAFCGAGSPCAEVRASDLSKGVMSLLNVSLPQLGLAAYLTVLTTSLLARTAGYHLAVAAMAVPGGLFAAYLLYAQAVTIGVFCPWCVAVDVSAIVAAIASVFVFLEARRADLSRPPWSSLAGPTRVALAWAIAGGLAVALPLMWGRHPRIPAPPPDIAGLQIPGKVLIVQFTDFECPFCRKLHPVLEEIAREHGDRVVLLRKMKPLSGHPGALPAALGYLCVPEPERAAFAEALYRADVLNAEAVARLAAAHHVDPDAFSACVASPATKKRLEEDTAMYERLGPRGLPLTYVNGRVVLGFDAAKIRSAVALEASGGGFALPLWALFAALGAAGVVSVVLTLRAAAEASSARQGADSKAS